MELTIIYTAIIIISGLLTNDNRPSQRRNYVVFVTVLLTLVAGLRSIWVGTDDTSLYYYHFIDNINKTVSEIWMREGKDPFYYVFQKLISDFVDNNFQLFLILSAAFFAISSGYLINKESSHPLVSYIILLSLGFFFFSMNGLRQSLAISVLMLAYFPLKNRHFLSFLALVAVATAFHSTAAIFLMTYPAVRAKLNYVTVSIYILAVVGCMLYGESVLDAITDQAGEFDDRFQYYQSMKRGLTYSGLVQLLLFGGFAFSRYRRVIRTDTHAIILYVFLIIAILAQTMATVIAEMFRVAMYFSIFLIVLIPKVLTTISSRNQQIITFSLCVALLIYFFFLGAGRVPHHFYFESGWGN